MEVYSVTSDDFYGLNLNKEDVLVNSLRLLNKDVAVAVLMAQALVVPGFAAGFQLNEISPSLQGSAMAGAAAANNDVSALFNNPATLSTLKETQFYLGASEFLPNIQMSSGSAIHTFNVPGIPSSSFTAPVNGRAHQNKVSKSAFIPNGSLGWRFADKFSVGVAIVEPYYLSNHYAQDSVVRFASVKSELNSVNINPSLAYQVSEQWSLGVGFQAQYLKTVFSNFNGIYTGLAPMDSLLAATRPSYLESDGWGYGYTLGGLYQPDEFTRVGISYRSQISTSLSGAGTQYTLPGSEVVSTTARTFLFNGESGVDTHIKTPGVLALGLARDINDWTLKGSFQVNFWNRINNLRINMPATFETADVIPMKWRNSWFAALGADYRYNSTWTARAGVAFDQTPTRDTRRDPRIPDQDRFWLNMGLSYFLNNHLSVDGAYSHIFMNDKTVKVLQKNMRVPGAVVESNQIRAQYTGSDNVVSLAIRYRC